MTIRSLAASEPYRRPRYSANCLGALYTRPQYQQRRRGEAPGAPPRTGLLGGLLRVLAGAPAGGAGRLLGAGVGTDELLGVLARLVVRALVHRGLHEVGGRAVELAADAVVERQLAAADRVDHDPGRVRGVPDLELHLRGQRHAAERLALEPDVGPLAVGEPRHVVGRADVHVVGLHLVLDDRGDRVGLGDLLGLKPLALEHVVEVHVAAHVELRRARELDAAVAEQAGQRAVDDRGADLRLDVVSDDRQGGLAEAVVPVLLARDEDRDAVHERAAGLEDLLDVPLRALLGADRQIAHDDVGLGFLEDLDDVDRRARSLGDLLGQVLAEAVVRHPALDLHAQVRDVVLDELDRVVLAGPDRLGEVLADLVGVDVERRRELDVADVVAAEIDVHQPRHPSRWIRVAVVMDALDEGVGAVAHADDRYADLVVLVAAAAVGGRLVTDVTAQGKLASEVGTSPQRTRLGRVRYSSRELFADVEDALEPRDRRQRGEHVDGDGDRVAPEL